MVRLYLRNLRWNTTKEQLRSFLWRYAAVDAWQAAASLYMMRPRQNVGHENHASAFVDGLSQQEAADVLRHCGGALDDEVCAWKRLHVEAGTNSLCSDGPQKKTAFLTSKKSEDLIWVIKLPILGRSNNTLYGNFEEFPL